MLLQRRAEQIETMEATRQAIHPDDVAAMTTNRLQSKAETYFQQMLKWRPLLEVNRLDDVKILQTRPHLGYASIVWSQTPGNDGNLFPWIFYFCNFKARFGTNDDFFENIPLNFGVTFFGLALSLNEDGTVRGRNTSIRGNGLLFATSDPAEAFENVSRLCDMKKIWIAISKMPKNADKQTKASA